jgi:hypothetical protein
MPTEWTAFHLLSPEIEAGLRAKAKGMAPNEETWADLIVGLHEAQFLEQSNTAVGSLTPGMTSAEHALRKIIEFLQQQPGITEMALEVPLHRLNMAIGDLANGRTAPMLKPAIRLGGNPGNGEKYETLVGFSARALKEFIAAKPRNPAAKNAAAKRIADLLKEVCPDEFGAIKPGTVINWYERLEQGAGPGAPDYALDHYREPLPPEWGDNPSDIAEILLRAIKANAATRL